MSNILYFDVKGNSMFPTFKDVRSEKASFVKTLYTFLKESEPRERFLFTEVYRNMVTSLRFLKKDNETGIFAISSSLPEEGKTFNSILIAKTLAEIGNKVLIVDCDLRKPQLHNRFGLNNIKGLSNILTNNIEWNNAIQNVKNIESLDIITSGTIPPNPITLFTSEEFETLVNNWKNSNTYNFIIFDCPPIIGLSDVSLIGAKSDGICLIVSL